jgi:SAM-dependent methyltransferase
MSDALTRKNSEPATVAEPRTCPVCDGGAFELAIVQDGMAYYRCCGCELVFLFPSPSDQDLAELYGDSQSALISGYFSKVPSKMHRARGRVKQLERVLDKTPAGQRFLDVGCSGGFVSEAARALGYDTTGIDPDGEAIAYANQHYPGIRFVHTMVEPFAAEAGRSFDAVYCSEVLEHVGDVNRFVAALSALMVPGGVLYLTTPDIGHWRRLLARHGMEMFKRRFAYKPGLKIFARKTGGDG